MVSVQYYRFFEIINAVELKISIKLTNCTHTQKKFQSFKTSFDNIYSNNLQQRKDFRR